MAVVDLVGGVGSIAGVIMVGKQGGKGAGATREGGGGTLTAVKALQIQDKYCWLQENKKSY